MKLSKVTIEILKNLASINQGMIFKSRKGIANNECDEECFCRGSNSR